MLPLNETFLNFFPNLHGFGPEKIHKYFYPLYRWIVLKNRYLSGFRFLMIYFSSRFVVPKDVFNFVYIPPIFNRIQVEYLLSR